MIPVYFDTEFTGLHQYTKLISIGLVSHDGHTFYGEFSDYADGFASKDDEQFFKESLEPNLHLKTTHNCLHGDGKNFTLYGNSKRMAEEIGIWLLLVGDCNTVQMWSDCYAYDWMLFCNLWGHALNLPTHIHYIPMDLSTLLFTKGINPDIYREKYAGIEDKSSSKHNALHDAQVIKMCVERAIRHASRVLRVNFKDVR